MKRLLSSLMIGMAMPLLLMAQGWPENYGGVMLQGFYWDSYNETKWTQLTDQSDELSAYFNLIWVPNSGQTKADEYNSAGNQGYENMGYMPVYWLRHNTCFGTEEELKTMISTFKSKGTGIIEDVVINHKNGLTNWADFPNEDVTTSGGVNYKLAWCTDMTNLWGICKNDELFISNGGVHDGVTYTCGDAKDDEGDNFDGCRDLDHTNSQVRENIKTYLKYLTDELGYAGFRYDMVKGYAAYYVGQYDASVNAEFSVGEYWDSKDAVKKWIQDTKNYGGYQSAAFDFGLKFSINSAFGASNWGALNDKGNAADTEINRYAVTFVENHDTYRDANRLNNNVLAANAFILAMPGTPCIFWPHWQTYKHELKKMIKARKAAGITNQSAIIKQQEWGGGYVTEVEGTNGKVLVISGYVTGYDTSGFTLVSSGTVENPNYAFYVSNDVELDFEPTPQVDNPADFRVYARSTDKQQMMFYTYDDNIVEVNGSWGDDNKINNTTVIGGKTWYYYNYDLKTYPTLRIIVRTGDSNRYPADGEAGILLSSLKDNPFILLDNNTVGFFDEEAVKASGISPYIIGDAIGEDFDNVDSAIALVWDNLEGCYKYTGTFTTNKEFRFIVNNQSYKQNWSEDEEVPGSSSMDGDYYNRVDYHNNTSTVDESNAGGNRIRFNLPTGTYTLRFYMGEDGVNSYYTISRDIPMRNMTYISNTSGKLGEISEKTRTINGTLYNSATSWADNNAYVKPVNVDIYIVTGIDQSDDIYQAKLRKLDLDYIPANMGMLLFTKSKPANGTDRNYVFETQGYGEPKATYDGTDNILKAVIEPAFIPSTVVNEQNNVKTRNFMFGYYRTKPYGNETKGNYIYKLGFWRSSVDPTDVTHLSSPNMAYLALTPEQYGTTTLGLYDSNIDAAAAPYIHFVIDDDATTAIVPVSNVVKTDDGYYTLQGVRVEQPLVRGVYIHKGKKVIVR